MRGALNKAQRNFNSDLRTRVDAIGAATTGRKILDPVKTFNAAQAEAGQGATVTFQAFRTEGVDRVEVVRNTSRDIGSGAVVQSYSANQMQLNRPIETTDSAKFASGSTLYYWLRAIPINPRFRPIVRGPFAVTVP